MSRTKVNFYESIRTLLTNPGGKKTLLDNGSTERVTVKFDLIFFFFFFFVLCVYRMSSFGQREKRPTEARNDSTYTQRISHLSHRIANPECTTSDHMTTTSTMFKTY